tara:strand:- start:312 stop:962 length:651 start_codon:yes stop_codon:yes gene_type:complete
MSIKLKGSSDGSVSLDAPADTSPSGTDVTFTLPTADGSAGQVLTTNGSGALSFANEGKILQVVSTTKTDTSTFNSVNQAYTSTVPGLTVAITPSSTSSQILIRGVVCFSTNDTGKNGVSVTLLRGSTEIGLGQSGNSNTRSSFAGYYSPDDNRLPQAIPFEFLDSPSTTSETTYGLKLFQPFSANINVHVNLNGDGSASGTRVRTISTITAMEVAA